MGKIVQLSEQTARQIAAGEVIERPASVVKELLENALDAGADSITIRIEQGGIGEIEVRDNGCGMSSDDLALAPLNFSTSKISQADDIMRVASYGFRGEALASIGAVSRMEIVTSIDPNGEGHAIAIEGSKIGRVIPAAAEKGTSIRVRDLFFNTPARRSFLKSQATEKRRILETILSYAMILPGVEIHYTDQDRHVLDLPKQDSWRDRISIILGASTMKHMVPLEVDGRDCSIRGFTSLPTFTRSSRTNQFIYVNRRLVREKMIIHALNEAYRGVIPQKRFSVTILALEMPPEIVDVNVHPSKLEVRLRNERSIYDSVRRALAKALSSSSEQEMEVHYTPGGQASRNRSTGVSLEIPQNPTPYLFARDKTGEGPEDDQSESKIISLQSRIKDATNSYLKSHLNEVDISTKLSLRPKDEEFLREHISEMKNKVYTEEGLFWQFNKSFIFIQVHGGLVIIDQHAAHERIIFDSSKNSIENSITVSQQLLFPIKLELSLSELEVMNSSLEIFERLGFVLEPFGGKSILVRGYPQGLKNWEEGKLLLQIFDDIVQDNAPGETHKDKIIASFACRSAVKAGQKLSVDEMQLLADELFAVENPYSCPHGRPTVQRISLGQIEKWFLR